MAGEFQEITVEQLAARLRVSPGRYGFLLGAGCSIGAGIPAATGTIKTVAERLGRDPETWKPTYAQALDTLGPLAVQQDFLAELIKDKKSTDLHQKLAALVEARLITATFTTNFDRLVERTLAHGEREVVTVSSQDSARAVLATGGLHHNAGPSYVVKLHGDYLIRGVSNQPWQVAQLAPGFRELFPGWLTQNGLVVVGYGIGDASIRRALEDAATNNGLPFGLSWVARGVDSIPEWVTHLQRMRQVPWIEVLWVHDAEQLFDQLFSRLVGGLAQPSQARTVIGDSLPTGHKRGSTDPRSPTPFTIIKTTVGSLRARFEKEWELERLSQPPGIDDGKYILAHLGMQLQELRITMAGELDASLLGQMDQIIVASKHIQQSRIFLDGGVSYDAFWANGEQLLAELRQIEEAIPEED